MKINGAEALIKALEKQNVTTIFGYPGGATLPIHDALLNTDKIVHRLVRNEQSAAHAASGYSRVSDVIGVCLSTSGPGATNLVTGIATAFMDSIPLIAITGQVATNMVGTDAFQEVDITGITLPIVKHSYLVKDANDIPQIVEDAFHIANTGRKGPVLIDLPKDVQAQIIEYKDSVDTNIIGYKPNYKPNSRQGKRFVEELAKAKKPLFFVGGGVVHAHASQELRDVLKKVNVPVISTLMALGSVDCNDPQYFGMIGLHGHPSANYAAMNCDLLVSLGARFDDRSTIVAKNFAPNAKIVHV
ncbi:MAG: thiamine pyrophosphate-binding protein, partial [Gallicola sp.]|nr:thiamine pyrophosphate-binding protein [Gallicola sp.]